MGHQLQPMDCKNNVLVSNNDTSLLKSSLNPFPTQFLIFGIPHFCIGKHILEIAPE